MVAAAGIAYWSGFIVTLIVLYNRAGLADVEPDWREILIGNLGWFILLAAKTILWPITLAAWLLQGRPASTWRAVTQVNGRPARKIVRATV